MRGFILTGLVLLTVLLASCGAQGKGQTGSGNSDSVNDEVTNSSSAEATEGDFVYRLVSEKEQYGAGEAVALYAELEYLGDEEEVTIYHAASPFYFPITEKTRGYEIGYMMEEPLVTTTLKKGEPVREEYKRSGGFSEQDEKDYVDFIKSFLENGFPAGHYVVDGYANFYVQSGVEGTEDKETFTIKANIEFEVSK